MENFKKINENISLLSAGEIKSQLIERIKELICLYSLTELIENENSINKIFSSIPQIISSAWQYPEITTVKLSINNESFTSEGFRPTKWMQSGEIFHNGKILGTLEIYYLNEMPTEYEGPFLKEERFLLDNICVRIERVIQRFSSIDKIKESEALLQRQKNDLEIKNLALNEVLFQIELEKTNILVNIKTNIDTLIMPIINRIKKMDLDIALDILTDAFNNIYSPLGIDKKYEYSSLSHRELEICQLLKRGLTTKDISDFLSISTQTVSKHRFNIRKKLGIKGEKKNLYSILQKL